METIYNDLLEEEAYWASIAPTDPNLWETFLPSIEINRQEAWAHNTALFKGRHADIFAEAQLIKGRLERAKVLDVQRTLQDIACKLYLTANYCGLLSKTCAAFLFGENIKMTPSNGEETLQAQLNKIAEQNEMQRMNLMQARTQSSQGYTFYRVKWDKAPDWDREGVVVEAIPGCHVFPHLAPGDVKQVTGYTIAYKVEHNGVHYLKREIHTPGTVRNRLDLLEGSTIIQEVPLGTVPAFADIQPEFKTDYPGLFVQYVPNLESIDEFWGMSDYEDIESLQDALNNRLTGIDEILDKHTNPILVVPQGLMTYDVNTQTYHAVRSDLDMVEINNPEYAGSLPRYVTWDGQLSAAFDEIDKLMEMMMMVSQMSPSVFGTNGYKISAESAKALKIRLIQTLAKINDKRMPFDAALKNVFHAALWLENNIGGGSFKSKDMEQYNVNIQWFDGIPDDELETTTIHAARVAAGIESKETAIRIVQDIDGDELAREYERTLKENGSLIDNPFMETVLDGEETTGVEISDR